MIGRLLLALFAVALASAEARAFDVWVGVGIDDTKIMVYDAAPTASGRPLATLDNGKLAPLLGIATDARYFGSETGWGYHVQFVATPFRIARQQVDEAIVNYGTSIDGYVVSATPILYYHLFRHEKDWVQFKLGFGFGIGYANLRGNFRITEPTHPKYGQIEEVKFKGWSDTGAALWEISYKPHSLFVIGSGPVLRTPTREYQVSSFTVGYRYMFHF